MFEFARAPHKHCVDTFEHRIGGPVACDYKVHTITRCSQVQSLTEETARLKRRATEAVAECEREGGVRRTLETQLGQLKVGWCIRTQWAILC